MKGSVVLITGRMGSGKSHYVVSQLPALRGVVYTNLPVNDACPREVVKVDTETIYGWVLRGEQIKGPGYLIVDEAHFIFGTGLPTAVSGSLKKWITLTRKRGIKIWLLTQSAQQLNRGVAGLADFERLCYTRANEPDPVFGLTVDDWNQIKAKLTGKYTPVTWVEEFTAVGKSRISLGHKPHVLSDKIYGWYDSYSVDEETDTGDLGVQEEEEYKILSWRELLGGIVRRNWLYFVSSHVSKVLFMFLVAYVFYYHGSTLVTLLTSGVVRTKEATAQEAAPLPKEEIEDADQRRVQRVRHPMVPVPVAHSLVADRVNRIGTMHLTAGRLYDASSIYHNARHGTRTGLYPAFGKARGTGGY